MRWAFLLWKMIEDFATSSASGYSCYTVREALLWILINLKLSKPSRNWA
jgi:hypothetical protein